MNDRIEIFGRWYTWEEVYKISGLCEEDFLYAYSECLDQFRVALSDYEQS